MLTDGRTDGKLDPYIAPCLRQAQQKEAKTIKPMADHMLTLQCVPSKI